MIWKDILIPLISSLLGGLLTFLGVLYTIKHQTKKAKADERLKFKPYLKIKNEKSNNKTFVIEPIQTPFEPENINPEVTKHCYAFIIKDFCIMNSNNAECVLKEIIIDNQRYKLKETLVLGNELIQIVTTDNSYVSIEKKINSIYLTASDLLGNLYYYECQFKYTHNYFFCSLENNSNEKIYQYYLIYQIINIGLPQENIIHE